MKSVFVAFDPPKPPTGGGTRTYQLLKAVSEVSSCHLVVCFPVAAASLPDDIQKSCTAIDISKQGFPAAKTSRIGSLLHQLRLLLFSFSIPDEGIVRLADYYVQHPYSGSATGIKKKLYELTRIRLFRKAKKVYGRGYTFAVRTLERINQYMEMKPVIDQAVASADLVWIDFSYPLPFFSTLKQTYPSLKVVCNAHNLEYRFLERMAAVAEDPMLKEWLWLQAGLMRKTELEGFAGCDLVVVCSEEDQQQLEALLPVVPVKTLPNGVDLSYFHPTGEKPIDPVLLFTGTMNYAPNQDAVHYFMKSVFPKIKASIPACRFVIAGANASSVFPEYEGIDGVELVNSPADMRPLYNRASVVVVPLRSGSGTRLKILEAAAMKKPIVTTSIGAEGLLFRDIHDVFFADEDEVFAACVIDVLSHPHLYADMQQSAYMLTKKIYDWQVIRKQTAEHVLEMMQ